MYKYKYNNIDTIDNDSSINRETDLVTIYHIIMEALLHIICFSIQPPHLSNNINMLYLLLRERSVFKVTPDLNEYKEIILIIKKVF